MRVIEVLLLSAIVSGCYDHGRKKVADTNTNWLDCEVDDDCDAGFATSRSSRPVRLHEAGFAV